MQTGRGCFLVNCISFRRRNHAEYDLCFCTEVMMTIKGVLFIQIIIGSRPMLLMHIE